MPKVLKRDTTGGFTLVELLVVIAIIGVLATLVLLQLGAARARSRDAKRIADVNQLRSALELYYEDNGGVYPDALSDLDGTTYITRVPQDPLDAADYGYAVSAAKHSYMLYSRLEQKAVGALNGDADINGPTSVVGGGVDGSAETCDTRDACIYDLGNLSFD
ncbi:MAG TPA: type II secretion system protein [Candidatus Paceibacterota bacterium]|nr:type II secretion system protein [Candidatus Paceibacterota bacterium]